MKKNRVAEPVNPGIKLFGRTIPSRMRAPATESSDDGQILSSEDQVHNNNVSEEDDAPSSQLDDFGSSSGSCEEDKLEPSKPSRKAPAGNNINASNSNSNSIAATDSKKSQSPNRSPSQSQNPSQRDPTMKSQPAATGKQGAESPPEKPGLKRPDKLVPCPRCNSMETKFCYFNNYNVNQPRHFCKNCQRYWTAGGTLRNVPVGAGRRKSKHNPGPGGGGAHHHDQHQHHHQQQQHHHQQHNKNEKLAATRMKLPPILPQEICHFGSPPETSPSGSVLTSLNSSSPASINSTIFKMHLAAAAAAAAVASQSPGDSTMSPSSRRGDSLAVPESSTETTTTGATTVDTGKKPETPGEAVRKECNGGSWPCFAQQHPEASGEMVANWLSSVWAAGMPAWAPIAASLWGPAAAAAAGGGGGGAGAWNVPWGAAAAAATAALAAAASANCSPPPFSKVLGKHPREKLECGRVDGCLWAPKTLRIDDPGEAAKSSIWQTLGLDKFPAGGAPGGAAGGAAAQGSSGGVYKLLQSKGGLEDKGGQSQKVYANPAALSRSLGFQENRC